MYYDEDKPTKIDYTLQPDSITKLDRTGEVPLVPLDMERQELYVPELLKPTKEDGEDIYYHIIAQNGETEIIPNVKSQTSGYNGSFLGPVMKLRQGKHYHITTENQLDEVTTYHWHGLIVPEQADGGCRMQVQPGEKTEVNFEMINEASTYWFHPHPHEISPQQIYKGLTGLIINEDNNSDRLKGLIPDNYGVDDLPIITWDRFFDDSGQLDFESIQDSDGNRGDVLLINGTPMAKVSVEKRFLRLRLLNAANVTNFKYELSNGAEFYQIATDGGFLNYPTSLDTLWLTPAERAEIVIDLDKIDSDRVYLMVNDYHGLEINIANHLEKNVDFNYGITLRPADNLINIVRPKEIKDLNSKFFSYTGTGGNVVINNRKFDMWRSDEFQPKDTSYVWRVVNTSGGEIDIVHNVHIHATQFRILARDGKVPPKNEMGYKDTAVISPGETVDLLVEFPIPGVFMYHCHNFAHENNGMMGNVEVTEEN